MKNLTDISTEELQNELKRRADAENKIKKYPHIFMYSVLLHTFETNLIRVEAPEQMPNLNAMMLRARFNSHREINIYSVLLNKKDGEDINRKLDDPGHLNIFKKLEKIGLTKIPF